MEPARADSRPRRADRYAGTNVRFRIIGGGFPITGRGIDLSISARAPARSWTAIPTRRATRAMTRRATDICAPLPERAKRRARADRRDRGVSALVPDRAWPPPQTILVVEDEASIASFVSLYLKNAGYTVRPRHRRRGAAQVRPSRRR